MRERKFQKGAISVFLVIILIPCMVISSVFVDMSRVVMAKGYSSSAADLALNSLMANYDPDLSEYYGMVASCQDIDQFYEESARFFLEALYSQGLNAEDAQSLLAYVNASLIGSGVHDLFQVEVQTETKDIITPLKNASLGESAVIIKDDIVEFMKYRAPVEITANIIDRLSKCGAADTLKNASKDEKLVEEKQDYAEAEEGFMDAAYKTYKKVKEYESLRSKYKLDLAKMQTMMADMKDARETYREVVKLIISNLNGTSDLKEFKRPTRELNKYSYTEKSNHVHSYQATEKGSTVYYIKQDKIDKLLSELETNIAAFKAARKAVSDKVTDDLINASIGTQDNQYHPVQWWKKAYGLITSGGNNSVLSKYESAADNMLKSYSKVLAIKSCKLDKDVKAGWESTYDSLTQSVTDLQKDFLTADVGEKNNNMYLKLVNRLEKYSKDYKNQLKDTEVKLANGKTVKQAITDVDSTLSKHSEQLGECIDLLNTIIDGGGILKNNPYSLSSLSKKAKEYNEAYGSWKSTANSTDTTLGEQDREEIQQKEENGEKLAVSPEDINKFKERAVRVRDKLQSVKDTIESMKLGSKKLIDINNTSTAYDAIKNDIGENLTNSAIKSKAEQIFKNKFKPYSASTTAEVASIDFSSKDSSPNFKENEPVFHNWLYDKFKDVVDDNVTKAKNKKSEKEKEAEQAEKEAKEADRSGDASKINLYKNKDYKAEEFPSGLDGNLPFNTISGIAGTLTTTITSLVDMKIDGIRDALYSTEYVMDMFSYATYVYEGKYKLGMETKGWSAADAEAAYSKNKYSDVNGNATTEKTWLSEKKTDRYNKTLTNHMINSDNNVLHGAEVEYVLFGKTNKENIASAYANIYLIRYPLNTVSGFQHFWGLGNKTGRAINAAANALSGATGGIVPAAAIKCVAILLLVTMETGSDLNRLSKGFQVELYKSQPDQWACAIAESGTGIDSDFSASTGEGTACANGLFYRDYLYLFVLMGFQSNSASEMYRRTADLIQVNMRKYTGDSGYMMKNAKTHFQVNATIRVDPLMLALPMAQMYGNNPSDRTDWCTFTIQEKRGYS